MKKKILFILLSSVFLLLLFVVRFYWEGCSLYYIFIVPLICSVTSIFNPRYVTTSCIILISAGVTMPVLLTKAEFLPYDLWAMLFIIVGAVIALAVKYLIDNK